MFLPIIYLPKSGRHINLMNVEEIRGTEEQAVRIMFDSGRSAFLTDDDDIQSFYSQLVDLMADRSQP